MNSSTTTAWTVDAEGFVECPECGERKRAGAAGVGNIQRNHTGSKICKEKAAKRDRDKGEKMKNTSIFGYFQRGRAKPVPSTVTSDPVPQATSVPQPPFPETPSKNMHLSAEVTRTGSAFLHRLEEISNALPLTIPEAIPTDTLAQFSDPAAYDNSEIASDDLWEEMLNPLMKNALGWGTDTDVTKAIRRGRLGFGGLVGFVRYYTETRGVNEALFEGKLSNLMECATKAIKSEAHSVQEDPPPRTTVEPIDVDEIADIEEAPVADKLKTVSPRLKGSATSSLPRPCPGFILDIPSGQSPYTTYPYGLHADTRYVLPWSPYTNSHGVFSLFAHRCKGTLTLGQSSCSPCRSLLDNNILQGITARMKDGVAENTPYLYHGISGLVQLLDRKNKRIEVQHLRGLNQARSLVGRATALADHKRFLVAISSGKVERVDRLVRIALDQKRSIRAVLELFNKAAIGLYHPKSFDEEDDMRGLVLLRMGGTRLANFGNRALGLPSASTLRTRTTMPPIIASYSKPTTVEVGANIVASFESVMELVKGHGRVLHAVLMFDEIATEKRIRLDLRKDVFLGVCRQHGHRTALEFTTEDDLKELFHALDNDEVHYAAEATVGALGLLCDNNRIYPARAILVSGDCKRETGGEHSVLLQTTLDSVANTTKTTDINIRTVCLASDGEKRRGAAMAKLTFKKHLSPTSNIFPHLSGLTFMDMHVGDDDLTCDKDWKHLFKRLRNLLLRERGIVIAGIRITPAILRSHFSSEGSTAEHIRATFNPDDLQDVRIAFDMLKDIWSLPRTPSKPDPTPGFQDTREALWIFGQLVLHLLLPFLCVDLSLSEQLEHLSAAAHLAMALYREAGKDFLPTELYADLMIMIKNAHFCIAKMKVDDPNGSFWIILLGTDRLEQLFGILRTMVGNNVNVDLYQLVERLSGTTEVSNILAKYPHWDRGPRRLQLPRLTRESGQLVSQYDHLSPAAWKGDVKVSNVTLQTSWRRGRRIIEEDFPLYADTFRTMENEDNITILSPSGKLLINIPLPEDDVDESLEDMDAAMAASSSCASEDQMVIEDTVSAAIEAAEDESTPAAIGLKPKSKNVVYCGQEMSKIKALGLCSKYRTSAGSTDRLRRVQAIGRHFSARSSTHDNNELTRMSAAERLPSDGLLLVVQDPIASLLRCDGRYWLCIGEVNGLKDDERSVDFVEHAQLPASRITVSYQLLGLRATDSTDDPTLKLDWRTYRMLSERTFTVPGSLIQPINPDTSTPKSLSEKMFYLLDSRVLVALAAGVFQSLSASELKSVPNMAVQTEYPYRERLGKAAFLCQRQSEVDYVEGPDPENPDTMACPYCDSPKVYLELKHGQRILEHIGAHILYDKNVPRTDEPCGCCLRPGALCLYYLTKGRGAQGKPKIDDERTTCPIKLTFSYGVASVSTQTAPCSNVPLKCPSCKGKKPAVWRYNLEEHYRRVHDKVDTTEHKRLWDISNFEKEAMKEIWKKRQRVVVKRKKKKTGVPSLVVSDAHRSGIPASAPLPTAETREVDSEDSDAHASDEDAEDDEESSEEDYVGQEERQREIEVDSAASFYSGLDVSDYVDVNPADFAVSEDDDDENSEKLVIEHDSRAGLPTMAEGTVLPKPDAPEAQSTTPQINNTDTETGERDIENTVELSIQATAPDEDDVNAESRNPADIAPNSTVASDGLNLAGRSKRKRKILEIHGLNDCECGVPADPASEDVVQCKRDGCETQWWHLACIGLELAPRNWVCRTCKASGGGKATKVARK